jgi:PadR family transcriptional regulator AphA
VTASLAEHVVLALVVEEPRHGWSIVRELSPDAELGAIWSLSRPLTYRAIDQLEAKGLVTRGEPQAGQGPTRVVVEPTAAGRRASRRWLLEPVRHVRDLRTEFLLKATLLRRSGGDLRPLLDAQEQALSPVLAALVAEPGEGSPVALWRAESAASAQRFFDRLRSTI